MAADFGGPAAGEVEDMVARFRRLEAYAARMDARAAAAIEQAEAALAEAREVVAELQVETDGDGDSH